MTDLLDDDEEFTELHSAQFSRVDLVGAPANGSTSFLVMKQDAESAGLLDAGFVRDLIAKSEPDPEPAPAEQVTMTGSPAAIAKMIHEAAVRHDPRRGMLSIEEARALYGVDDVAKAEMSSKSVNDLDDDQFAYIEPGGKKDESGKTTPRSKRHFPINDAAHVRNALARASSSPFGDKAMPKIRSAAKKFGVEVSKEAGVPDTVTKDAMGPELDDGIDGMDPTVPLCAPDDDDPGDPTDPGSPAWEAIDAATACKWTTILARARVAVDLLAEREMLEAASADPDDMENAFDLQDVCCAIDYAIGVLAPFAVAEQSEADCGADEMAMVGKSAGEQIADLEASIRADNAPAEAVRKAMAESDLSGPLGVIESIGTVIRKTGRVLSGTNEAHLREAANRLNTVLSSLPQAPTDDGQPVAKSNEETTVTATETQDAAAEVAKADADDQAKNSGPVTDTQVPGMGAIPGMPQNQTMSTPSGRTVLKSAVYDQSRSLLGLIDPARITQVAKADADGGKVTMQAVFDEDGNLVGIVDPADITPVAGAGGSGDDSADAADPDGDGMPAAAPASDATDMTPAPAAETGTPADAAPDDGVAKQDSTTDVFQALESIVAKAVAAALGAQAPAEDIAKQADVAGLSEQVETLKARLAQVEEMPAAPKVFTNGQVPPAHQMRGQDQGAPPQVDVAKAAGRKRELYTAPAAEQSRIAKEMNAEAVDYIAALHAQRQQR